MMVNEFAERDFQCEGWPDQNSCRCMYKPKDDDLCVIPGQSILDQYDYGTGHTGLWVGILLCIVLGYRLLTWVVLTLKRV